MLKLKQEYNFPSTTRFVGYIFLVSSLFTMVNLPLLGLILAFIFSYVSFSKTNNKIHLEEELIDHKDLPRKKFPIKKYVHLSLLSATMNWSVYSRGNRKTTDLKKEYRVVLLNESHLKKIILETYSKKEEAKERLKELAVLLNRDVVKYNPQVISRKNRR